jgi:molybdate/tungstate transport system substrate-binding protein
MLGLHSSLMQKLAMLWVLVIAVVCVIGGAVAGYELHPAGSAKSSSPAAGSPALSITAAGTLATAFGQVGSTLVNNTPGAQDPTSAQTYQGSIAALDQLLPPVSGTFDVVASADYRLIPQILEPQYATWEFLFASNPEVLCYDPTAPALSSINTTNWPALVEQSGVVMGVANASTDPNGFNEIFVLQLEDTLLAGSVPSLYQHFYTGAVGSLAKASATNSKVEPETQVASLLSAHTVQVFITYRSYAITHHLSFVAFDPRVGLGMFDAADIAYYSHASTAILTSAGGTEVVTGAPVAYSVTAPSNAPNATLGDLFVTTLLSPAGATILTADGFTPITPAYLQGTGIPATLVPEGVPLPSSLTGLLP